MAIEIRELVIRVVIEKKTSPKEEQNLFRSKEANIFKRNLIEDCMEEIKEYLSDLNSR